MSRTELPSRAVRERGTAWNTVMGPDVALDAHLQRRKQAKLANNAVTITVGIVL